MEERTDARRNDHAVRLGETIHRLRTARGMTQKELAEEMTHRGADWGVEWRQQNVVRAEKGHGFLRFDEVSVLADVLEVPLDDLREGSENVEMIALLRKHLGDHMRAGARFYDAAQALHENRRAAEETLRELVASGAWERLPEQLLAQVDGVARGLDERDDGDVRRILFVEDFDPERWS